MSFSDTLTKLLVQQLESMLSVPPTPVPTTTQTTSAVNFSDPPSTRHLLLVEAKDNISREEIAIAKYDRVDVIYVSRETLYQVSDKMKLFNIKWRSVNMLFHGSADLEEDSICIFGIKMSMNRNIMMSDPNVQGLINFTKAVCQYTDDSLYVYTCAVGVVDGLKELCLRLDKECNLKSGIFLSTNTTGNGAGQDWNIEWGTKYGFLTNGVQTNEIEHASVALFRDIKKLTFTLASDTPTATTNNMLQTLTTMTNTTDKLNTMTASIDNMTAATNIIASQLDGLSSTTDKLNTAASSLDSLAETTDKLNAAASSLNKLSLTTNKLNSLTSSLDGTGKLITSSLGNLSSTSSSLNNAAATIDSFTSNVNINNIGQLLGVLANQNQNQSLVYSVYVDTDVDESLQQISVASSKADSLKMLYDLTQMIGDKMLVNGNQRINVRSSTISTITEFIMGLNANNSIDINLIKQYMSIFSKLNVI
jgi:hypothetical protein